jgi:hypothetical protein
MSACTSFTRAGAGGAHHIAAQAVPDLPDLAGPQAERDLRDPELRHGGGGEQQGVVPGGRHHREVRPLRHSRGRGDVRLADQDPLQRARGTLVTAALGHLAASSARCNAFIGSTHSKAQRHGESA